MNARRQFLKKLGISTAALPFLNGLPSFAAEPEQQKQRLIIMFSPNGTVPDRFWPTDPTDPSSSPILAPLAPFRDQMTVIKGISNQVGGDGDRHMRGMSCLLTGSRLHPGNIQGGSDTPAGWASSLSIDQEIKNFLQKNPTTRTRFGSLEIGVAVPDRADPWTRMSYAGSNQPLAPLHDPYQMFKKLYGQAKNREALASVLDPLRSDLKKAAQLVATEDRQLLEQHLDLVRDLEQEISLTSDELSHPEPELDPHIELINDNTPQLARMQMDLLVNALANDMTRVSTLQFMRSVGQARMRWLGIDQGHHHISHQPDKDQDAQQQLEKINIWFAKQLTYLAKRLQDTPDPAIGGNLLQNTTIVWLNELGKGNSHTLDDLPIVLLGSRANLPASYHVLKQKTSHNRLLISLAHSFGHHLSHFGEKQLSQGGPLTFA